MEFASLLIRRLTAPISGRRCFSDQHSAAATIANLERLRQGFARSARRARAREDGLLLEINETLQEFGAALGNRSGRRRFGCGEAVVNPD